MNGNTVTLGMAYGRVTQAEGLWQYDYGQKLIITGVSLPPAYEVHFANDDAGTSKTVIGTADGVDIPDEYLLTGEKIHVWIYLHGGESDGETEYHGILNVKRRAKPTDEEPTPVQQSAIDQALAAMSAEVSAFQEIADGIPQVIDDALEEAKESGEFDGPKGDRGDPGPRGERGEPGPKGDPGDPVSLINDSAGATETQKTWSAQKLTAELSAKLSTSVRGVANGVAELDASGRVPSNQLPSYVDDVLEFASISAFPPAGEIGKIYVTRNTNKTYRWSGVSYVEISESLALGETSQTAFRGDHGKTAYTHASAKGAAFQSGFYKITTNNEGHVTAVEPVTKEDIVALGIHEEADIPQDVAEALLGCFANVEWADEFAGSVYYEALQLALQRYIS